MKQNNFSKVQYISSLFILFFIIGCNPHSHTEIDHNDVINDACSHLNNGPDSTLMPLQTINGNLNHIRWRLSLPKVGSIYQGEFPFQLDSNTTSHHSSKLSSIDSSETEELAIFVSDSVHITLLQERDTIAPKSETLQIVSCPEIKTYKVYDLKYQINYKLLISTPTKKSVDIVVATLEEEHHH